MSSPNNNISRDVDNGGGVYSFTASNIMTGSVAEEVALTTSVTASNLLRSGFDTIAFYPGTLTSLTARYDNTTSSITLVWPTPGYDGGVGVALGGSAYLIQMASNSTYGNLANLQTIAVTVSTSAQAVNKIVGAGVMGLDPNTTYYAQVFLRDNDANVSGGPFVTNIATFTTLATAPTVGALEFLSVQTGSVTVAWIAPWSPFVSPSVSSMSNQGYVLYASSDNFGAIVLPTPAPVFSSSSYNSFSSTLTVGVSGTPLDLTNTYYFEVASLNWAGQPSTTTFTRLNFQIQQSTGFIHFGTMNPLISFSTVATSSMVITNVGNWPATIQLFASTATAGGSPWSLGTVPGIETAVLRGIWFTGALGPPAVGPPATEFTVNGYDTILSTTPTISSNNALIGNHNYQDNQSGVQIPIAGNSTMWFYFTLPTSSVSLGPETLTVRSQPLYP